jgi:putative transposase
MPKGKKHTPEDIVTILRRVEQGEAAEVVCRSVNISEATLYRWKQQYGAMELDQVKEVKALREENVRLKRLVADQALNIQVLKEVNSKMVIPSQPPRGRKRGCGGPLFIPAGVPPSGAGVFQPRLPAQAAGRVQTEAAIVELSRKHPRYGYRRVHAMVLRRGLGCARRTV